MQLFESNRLAFTQETLGEYIKALARLDRLDNSRMLGLMQVGAGLSLCSSRAQLIPVVWGCSGAHGAVTVATPARR